MSKSDELTRRGRGRALWVDLSCADIEASVSFIEGWSAGTRGD